MGNDSANDYLNILDELVDQYYLPDERIKLLLRYVKPIARSELENRFSEPMLWIGMYIAVASLVCILAMVADLLHGLRSRKLWFPCTYFRINAAFLTIISVAMKLPVDLTGSMPGYVDQAAKLGSMAFMCTMMANLLPCLAIMDNNDLFSNIVALAILVITLVVNVCIQIQTGAVSVDLSVDNARIRQYLTPTHSVSSGNGYSRLPFIYVVFLVVLLIVHACSCLAILKSKKIIETKFKEGHDRASANIQPSPREIPTVEMLQKHVRNHWIMAESGNPQFIAACFHTTSASAVICILVTILHTRTVYRTIIMFAKDYDSDYKWSTVVILIVQFIGVVIGTIAPLSRCFATLSFKVSTKIISSHFKVFKVERYWSNMLHDWKRASISHPFCTGNLEVVIEKLKRLIFNMCIGFQNGVVVVCKIIALIPFLFMICFFYCFLCMKWLLKLVFSSLGKNFEELEENNDLRPYVLQLEDEIELGEGTLKGFSKSMNRLIQQGAKNQPNNLTMLILEKSTSGFPGVKKFDHIRDVSSVDCWRLAVVTLTTVAVSLPNIEKEEVESLLESVKEGLKYVIVVEKSLNSKDDHISFQKAADTQWQEIRFDKKWLGNQLQNPVFQVNTARHIVKWFRDEAKNIVFPENRSNDDTGGDNDNSIHRFICANSMYHIAETILPTCHTNIDVTVSQKELFNSLSSMIADTIAACLTNLPQAIIMKCHTSVIEEREAVGPFSRRIENKPKPCYTNSLASAESKLASKPG
ncbi:hypothetical protein HanPI659440_Chr00c19g0734281 [Helianthus annuus]|nr:hypothetical protein HanPI659440_Chr00c19g0734281 [Helianthus annuus]